MLNSIRFLLAPMILVSSLAACGSGNDMMEPDPLMRADAGPDGGVKEEDGGFSLRTIQIAPSLGESETDRFRLRGRLRASSKSLSENDQYKLRGGLTPIAPVAP